MVEQGWEGTSLGRFHASSATKVCKSAPAAEYVYGCPATSKPVHGPQSKQGIHCVSWTCRSYVVSHWQQLVPLLLLVLAANYVDGYGAILTFIETARRKRL